MKRAAGVVLVIGAVVWLRRIGPQATDQLATTALTLGFMLVVALVTGELLRRFRLPRLTGYLLFGVLMGPYLGNVVTEAMARQLQVINGVATTLIALIAGLTLNFERLSRQMKGIVRLTWVTLGIAMVGVWVVAWVAWPWLPIAPGATGAGKAAMIALLGIIAISFSPTMTAAVISETGSRGRLSELVLAIVVLSDFVVLVLFSFGMQFARVALADGATVRPNALVQLAWEIGGAAAFGSLLGALFALYVRYVAREVTLVLLTMSFILSQVGMRQGFEPLVAAMAAGIVIENAAVAQGDALKGALRRGALPILVVFFVSVGASLQLDALGAVGSVAIGLALVRIALIRLGVAAGLRISAIDRHIGAYVWRGLISQAGITLGLVSVLATEFPTWGDHVRTLLVALIAIDELVGPMLFRAGLARAGELEARKVRPLIVASNREPYLHTFDDHGRVTYSHATGGVAIALDALMRERGGVWIAHGAGEADAVVVDTADKVPVPPDNPSYSLRRLWIEEPAFASYYGGFANEGLWPLCHMVDVRPKFRTEDWAAYRDINGRFAAAIDQELRSVNTPVFIQDYHLALVATDLRARRSRARTALFWHIPWPYPDRLRICPWRREILAGLVANDLLAFQVERDRRNFLLAVEEELGVEFEEEASRVRVNGHHTTVVSVPIGVDYDRIQAIAADAALPAERARLVERFRLTAPIIGIGVDRLDYTKGIPERLEALDAVMTRRADLRGRLTFVQIGVPSRSELGSYAAIAAEIGERIAELNARHSVPGGPPAVQYSQEPLTLFNLVALYRLAHFCIVSSLHDGMNLVAKEFVASRDDEEGVLVLSELAGAAQELQDALIINPYDVDGFAQALLQAIDMPRDERRSRMRSMRRVVAGRNVFDWASDILEGLESLWTKPVQYSVRVSEETAV